MRKAVSFMLAVYLAFAATPLANAKASAKTKNEDVFGRLKNIELESADKTGYLYFLNHTAYDGAEGSDITTADFKTAFTESENVYEFKISTPADGRYYLKLNYTPTSENREQIECGVKINGELQYKELWDFILNSEYKDTSAPLSDYEGNQVRAEQCKVLEPITSYIYDYAYTYTEPLSVNLKRGENTVAVSVISGEADINKVIFEPTGNIKSYEEVKNEYKANGLKEIGETVYTQAEEYSLKSTSVIFPISDRTSAATSPAKAGKIRLNTVGGTHWNTVGQYIKWNINVPESGLYKIKLRFRQNSSPGQASQRTLCVNGKIPFKEAMSISFPYNSSWQVAALSGAEEYLFYLNAGTNVIEMRNTPGEADTVLRVLNECVDGFNAIYRKLLMVLGSSPDLLRDYRLDKLYPEQIALLKTYADKLTLCTEYIEAYSGKGNSGAALIRSFIRQLEKMYSEPGSIPREFSYFKTNIGSLSTWIASAAKQPLEIDCFAIGNDSEKKLRASAGFFKQFAFSVGEYLASYVTDYELIGTAANAQLSKKALNVWVGAGRDQAQIVRNLTAKSFTPKTGIAVSVKNVDSTSLLSATVAGMGPDVVVRSSPDVFNYAMRSAAYPLSEFKDFESVASRFDNASLITLKYMGKYYGLPETLSFEMMFYRTDILSDLGLEAPKTWDELIKISSVLSNNNMSVGIPSTANTYIMMLMQSGNEIYGDSGMYTLFDTVGAINVFTKFTNFYENYGFPLSYEFQNRFRSGEMPIGVAGYEMYNTLQIAAPEINGLWKMAPIPGTLRENGEINNTALATVAAVMMLSDTKMPQEGWEFIKWWTDSDAQTSFADEIESILGKSSRYDSANCTAFENSSWNTSEKTVIKEQKSSLSAVEPMPGGYYLERNLNNAFRSVVYKGASPTDAMYEYTYKINSEFTKKRKEFGLKTMEDKGE